MAVRLAAVLIQTPSPVPGGMDLVDGVVGQLIGAPGIDLTLVGAQPAWSESSTDRMTIESLPADAAVLDWCDPAAIEAKMQGVDGAWLRTRHEHDPDVEIAGKDQRKLYAFDLRDFRDANQVVQSLRALLQSRQVKTVEVALNGQPLKRSPTPTSQVSPSNSTAPPEISVGRSLDLDDLVDQLDELDP